jgi:hypothetical protein
MIPVGIWVIGPNLARKAIDEGVVRVLNNTITNCPLEPTQGQTCDFYVNMSLKNVLPLSGKIDEVNVTMWNTNGPATAEATSLPTGLINGSIGYFTQPAISLKPSSTSVFEFTTVFYPNVSNEANPTLWATWTGFTGFYVQNLTLLADVNLVALGFLSYKVNFMKQLHCNCIEGAEQPFGCLAKKDPATLTTAAPRTAATTQAFKTTAHASTTEASTTEAPTTEAPTTAGSTTTTSSHTTTMGINPPASLFCEPLDVPVWNEGAPGQKWQDTVSVEFAGLEASLAKLFV